MKYKISTYAKNNGVTIRTVWNWIYQSKVKTERTASGGWLIVEDEVDTFNVGIYARVSSRENKDNLERQKNRLIDYCSAKGYKVTEIVTEIGSGLNDTRPKLEKLLMDKSINLIVVEHKDRLARFGINYIEKLMSIEGRKIECINPIIDERDDLMGDFISIITSFTARLYGQRRNKRRTEKLIEELKNND